MLAGIIGFGGMFLILLAFLMNQIHKWKEDDLAYDLTNSLGSLLLMGYAIMLKSYPFLILNGIWFIVSARDVVLDIKNAEKKKVNNHYKKR